MILADRSRHFRGLGGSGNCARARYNEYEAERTGVRPKSDSLPLATGTVVHGILAEVVRSGADREQMRSILSKHLSAYSKQCAARGFTGEESEQVGYLIAEQAALIEGIAWGFWRVQLPWLLSEFDVLAIEQEHEYAIGCACGLGDGVGTFADHDARQGCGGVGLMIRPDLEVRHRASGRAQTVDFKTSAWELDKNEYDQSPQMALQCMGAEKDLGEPVDSYWVIGLLKGKRDFFHRWEKDAGGLKKQGSIFCYGWYKAGQGGLDTDEWLFEYTKRGGFDRVPVWLAGLPGKPKGMSHSEYWVMEMMPEEIVRAQFQVLGPLQRPRFVEAGLLNQIYAEALKWQEFRLMGQPVDMLDAYAPQAWGSCYNYRRACDFLDICKGVVHGPLLQSGRFVRRLPHHTPELEKLKAEGFTFEDAEEAGGE